MITYPIGRDLDQCVGCHCFHAKEKVFLRHSLSPFEIGPKKQEYSTDLLSLVIQHFLNGDSYAVIAEKVLIPRPTIQSIIKKYNKTKRILYLSGRGRKRKTTNFVDRIIQRKIMVDRRKSASELKKS